jgi:hypothetical protein
MNRSEAACKAKYEGRAWVLELARSEESPVCLSCETAEEYRKWFDRLSLAIDEAKKNSGF